MRRTVLILLALLLLLISCKNDITATLLTSEEVIVISWVEQRTLVAILLDETVFFNKENLPIRVADERVVHQEDLQAVGHTLTLLVQVTDGQPLLIVDEQQQLNALVEGASTLRKTRLADTLAAVSGQNDPLSALGKIQAAYLFDLRGLLTKTELVDEYLTNFIEQARRSVKRR